MVTIVIRNGGDGGSVSSALDAQTIISTGGDGGRGTDGVRGARGGGTLALFINTIVNGITISARGETGRNGNVSSSDIARTGRAGTNRGGSGATVDEQSTEGTLGANGGIVFLLLI